MEFSRQHTGVGSLSLLQGIFPAQESNPGLPHCRWILYQLSHKGSPRNEHKCSQPQVAVSLQNLFLFLVYTVGEKQNTRPPVKLPSDFSRLTSPSSSPVLGIPSRPAWHPAHAPRRWARALPLSQLCTDGASDTAAPLGSHSSGKSLKRGMRALALW